MRILADKATRKLIVSLCAVLAAFSCALQLSFCSLIGRWSLWVMLLPIFESLAVLSLIIVFFRRRDKLISNASGAVNQFISGKTDARIECDEEGALFSLFNSVNNLASALNAQTERGLQANEAIRSAVSDISHQLKTPLASLNIYNGLISESDDMNDVRRFSAACETELDRMDNLIRSLLKLARLDAGTVVFEMQSENIAEIMYDLRERFSCRAELEGKTVTLNGKDESFPCDRSWISEAFGNIIKNALDHTEVGGKVDIFWKRNANILNVCICDNGSGINPEDVHHIFKRFYRSRFSNDSQGIGLGLPLSKTIIEAHSGTIEVDSIPGKGTAFHISFIIPTKL